MSERTHDPYAALRHTGYRRYLIGKMCAIIGYQVAGVAVTWEVYKWTHSATALGLVGLLNVIPLLALLLPAGMIADRMDRKRVVTVCFFFTAILTLLLAALAFFQDRIPHLPALDVANEGLRALALVFEHSGEKVDFSHPALPILYVIVFLIAVLRILASPSNAVIMPLLIPASAMSNAVTWNATLFEICSMAGPALCGFIVVFGGYHSAYLVGAVCEIVFVGMLLRVHYITPQEPMKEKATLRGMCAGAEFIWKKKVILAASGIDLFAVLLGGVVALLPVYADRILHIGPIGLGWLSAAPNIGACAMALWLAHRRPIQRPGIMLLWTVLGFGVAIMVFSLSTWFWLSFVALVFTGIFDNISVVIRWTMVQLLTPDALRGRVMSANQIFVGSSNELGTFRAGMLAAAFGPVATAFWGGVGIVAIVFGVAWFVPQLRNVAALDKLKPD